jgi:hypothetical protein
MSNVPISDPIHIEDLFLIDDLEQFGDTETAASLRACRTHSEFEAIRRGVFELLDRVLYGKP